MENTSENGDECTLPERSVIRSYLDDLIAKRRSREEVADWAVQFTLGDYDDVPVSDELAWEMLSTLAGADLQDSPESYLYGNEDFREWKNQLIAE